MARLKEITRSVRKGKILLTLRYTSARYKDPIAFLRTADKDLALKMEKRWRRTWSRDLIPSVVQAGANHTSLYRDDAQ